MTSDPQTSSRDAHLWALLSQSVVGRVGRVVVGAMRRAAGSSLAVRQSLRARQAWTASRAADHYRFVGAGACGAAVSMAALTIEGNAQDFWRMIVPALVGAYGIIVLVLSMLIADPSKAGQ